MIKNCSIRVKLTIMILSVTTPLMIFIVIYLLKGFQIVEVLRGYPYDAIILDEYNRQLNLVFIIMGVFILELFLIAYILEKCLFKPVSVLKNTSEKFLEGDYSAKIEIKNEDEIGLVAEALNTMAESIETLSSNRQAFMTHIFHEFRTPLNVIFSSIQLANTYKKNTDCETYKAKTSKQMDIIRQNCLRIMRLTTNLIDINRHDSGFLKIKPANYDIVKLIRDITNSVKRYTESKGIDLLFKSSIQSRIIACDPDMIERIILNLISNAIKFTDKNGTITVKIDQRENDIIFSVTDTGIGISEKKRNKLFELFTQEDDYIARNRDGSGIGLYLVKVFVEAHNGKIQISSKEFVGTTFEITIPIKLLDNDKCSSLNESQAMYDQSSQSKDMVNRINIEFSDIYSCYDDDEIM